MDDYELVLDKDLLICKINRVFFYGIWLSQFVGLACLQLDLFFALYKPLIYKDYVTKRLAFGVIIMIKEWVSNLQICLHIFPSFKIKIPRGQARPLTSK